jgi:hypothetical protein
MLLTLSPPARQSPGLPASAPCACHSLFPSVGVGAIQQGVCWLGARKPVAYTQSKLVKNVAAKKKKKKKKPRRYALVGVGTEWP